MSRFGLAVRREAGKQIKGLGSIPLRISFLFEKAVVCGLCFCDFVLHNSWSIEMALTAAHLNAGVTVEVTAV